MMLGHSEFIKKTILQQRPLGARALKPPQKISKMTKYKKESFRFQFLLYFGLMISLEHQNIFIQD